MRREDLEFLSNLRSEMQNQDHEATASPRIWGIMEKRKVWNVDPETADHVIAWDGESNDSIGEEDDSESVIAELVRTYGYPESRFSCCPGIIEVVETANDIQYEINGCRPFDVAGYDVVNTLAPGKVFLTKKAAKEYLQQYGYNHPGAYTYCMCADRCPEIEALLRIVETEDWLKDITKDIEQLRTAYYDAHSKAYEWAPDCYDDEYAREFRKELDEDEAEFTAALDAIRSAIGGTV